MPLAALLPPLDLSAVLRYVLTALVVVVTTGFLVKRVASRYFVVDAGFDAGPAAISVRGGGGGPSFGSGVGTCATCGNPGSKKCSRCKRAWYCSQECQSKHWKAGHQHKCKHSKPSDETQIVSSGNSEFRRRKASVFRAISLIPARGTCNVLKEPKKILFPYDEFVKLFNWDNPGFPPCGLVNCGNSCFANVVLQCLSSTRPLVAYLLERDHSRNCARKKDDWCFLCELQEHIQRAKQSSIPFSPINILSRLPNIGSNLGYGRQEDAHEFMRFAIDTMQSICLDEFGGERALDLSTQETTLIQYIFGGHLRSQVTCTKCNMTSDRYDNMMDLTVEIHGDAESLEQCLDQFTNKEWLDGDNKYKCDWCNDYVKACKHLTVHQAPNILTIALKRFQSGRFGKLNKRVSFPENLDLSLYMSGNSDGTDLYTLYAVVVHVDMLNASFFGHYICYTKDYYGRWYRIDDSKVMSVEVEDVLSEGAYMLLYSRRNARKEPFAKPMEPQKTKQPAEVILDKSGNLASPINVSYIPNYDDVSLVDTGVSNPRQTGHDREFSAEKTKLKTLDEPSDEQPLLLVKNSEDMDVVSLLPGNVSKEILILPSSVPKDISSVDSMEIDTYPESLTSKVEAKGSHINEDKILEEQQSLNSGEASSASTCILSRKMTYQDRVDPPLGSSFIYPSTAECSGKISESKNSEHPKEACSTSCSPMEIDSVGGKTLSLLMQNGSSEKSMAIFSHGFLNNPLGKESVDNIAKTQWANDSDLHVSRENGYCNGHSDLGVDKHDCHSITENGASINGFSANGHLCLNKREMMKINGKYDNSAAVSFLPMEDNPREGKRFVDESEANCDSHVYSNLELRPQTNYSNGASMTLTKHQTEVGSAHTNGNGNGVSNKNGQLKMPFDNNNCNNLWSADKLPGCWNEHNGLGNVNGFSTSVRKEENEDRHFENGVH